MTRATSIAAILAATALAGTAAAEPLRLRAEVGLTAAAADATSAETALGFGQVSGPTGALRAIWEGGSGRVRFEFHATLSALGGSLAGATRALAAANPAPPASLLDLDTRLTGSGGALVAGRIDRANLSYTTDHLVVRVGRQAITWGGGILFQPLDIVAPFPPTAIDTSYKPGVEMVYGQYLFDNGADIQAIWVPRPATAGGPVTAAASTIAVLASGTLGPVDARLLLARDRGENVVGLGLSGPLGGAAWTLEWSRWEDGSGTARQSWLANYSNFATLGDVNLSYFIEAYHNGFGVASSVPLDALPPRLGARLATGQVFYPGANFLAVGGTIEATPSLSLSPSVIVAPDDGSALAAFAATISLGDNSDIYFNAFLPIGADGTEFGGRETSAGSGVYSGPSKLFSLRFVRFF